jgi:polyribonucleotide nucleotidyltransferase
VEITVIKGSGGGKDGAGGSGGLMVSVQVVGPKENVAKARAQILHVVGQSDKKLLFRVGKRQHLGIIVGQGGKTVAQLMKDHRVTIQVLTAQNGVMIEEADDASGGTDTDAGVDDPYGETKPQPGDDGETKPQHGVYQAKRAIEQLLREQVKETEVVFIPERRVAAVIGAGGKTIAEIQQRSKAQVTVEPVKKSARAARYEDTDEEVKVQITGNPAQIRDARLRIEELCTEFAEEFPLPHPSIAGVIIGKGGKVVAELQRKTGGRVDIVGGGESVRVSGTPSQTAALREEIMAILESNQVEYFVPEYPY